MISWGISSSCFADTKTPARWKKLTECRLQAHRLQTGWNEKVGDADSPNVSLLPPTRQKSIHKLIRPPTTLPPTLTFKTLPWKLPLGRSGLLSLSCLFSLLGPNVGGLAVNAACTFLPHSLVSAGCLCCALGKWIQVWVVNAFKILILTKWMVVFLLLISIFLSYRLGFTPVWGKSTILCIIAIIYIYDSLNHHLLYFSLHVFQNSFFSSINHQRFLLLYSSPCLHTERKQLELYPTWAK